MSPLVTGLNKEMLIWARKRSGLTVDDVANSIGKSRETVTAWEDRDSDSAPTYIQLETLAYKVFRRPVAIFFFPEPPEESAPEHSFRTLPDFELQNLSADTRYRIRKASALQLSLIELNDGRNPASRPIFRDIEVRPTSSPEAIAQRIREYLDTPLQAQSTWPNTQEAFKKWRLIIEEAGIYIFKDSLKQEDISGFCLAEGEFPIIYVNNSTAFSRQIFTIFHELAHIITRVNGITKRDDRYVDTLVGTSKDIEVFCNRFAAEFLVPSAHFEGQLHGRRYQDQLVEELAFFYKVSREVILRKFLNRGEITSNFYRDKVQEWADEWDTASREGSGGNYYATQATYLGDKYLRLAFSRYHQGRFSLEQLAEHLNVKATSVPGLEPFSLR